MPTNNWFVIDNADIVDSPALLVYHARVDANIRAAVALVGGPGRLRPHVKTHKMRAVTELLLASGIHQFKCATIAEAEMLAQAGAPDVLLAYPVVGPKATRLLTLTEHYPATRFSCLVDNLDAARHLSNAFTGKPIDVFIDLNVGMNRTGVLPEKATNLFSQLSGIEWVNCIGLHVYDGHNHATDITKRTQEADAVYMLAEGFRRKIKREYGTSLTLVIGGSPTFAIHAGRNEDPLQTSPGTFVFWDAGYTRMLPELPFQIAAALLTRVVSVVDDHTLTLDLGYKSVAAESPLPRVIFPQHTDAEVINQNEEHLIVRVPDARLHFVGDVWYAIPIHICPTVALYERAFTVENGHVSGEWTVTARDRRIGA